MEAYFAWVREHINKVLKNSKTWNGFNYALNQEKYLKVFLTDGDVPMDNNAAEQSIRRVIQLTKCWSVYLSRSVYSLTIRKRQREGINAAKAQGRKLGRREIEIPDGWDWYYERWKNGHISAKDMMDALGLKRGTFYRMVKTYEAADLPKCP